jgi:hypothetical protein
MIDDPTFVPDDGSQAQEESSQTTPEVTQAPISTPTLSLEDVQRLMSEQETKLRAEFDERARKIQSKSDKAHAAALADAKVIEQNAELLGLDADAIVEAKRKIIDRKFTDAFAEEPIPAATVAPPYQPAPTVTPISKADVIAQLAHDQLDPFAIGQAKVEALTKQFSGRPQGDPQVIADWNAELARIRQDQTQQRQQQAQAQAAAQTAAAYGGAKPLGGGTARAGYDPVAELDKLNNQDPPDDPVEVQKYLARRKQLKAEAEAKGW